MCNDNDKWYKIWRGIDLSFQKSWWILTRALESLLNLHFNGLLLTKLYICFELRKYRGVMFGGTQYWYKVWRKSDLCFQKWHEEFGKVSPEPLKVSKLGLMASFYLKLKMYELKIYRGSYVSWQWRMMQILKRNWLVSSKLTWKI